MNVALNKLEMRGKPGKIDLKPSHMSGKQLAGSVIGAAVDKATSMITSTSNFLNARTQITDIDRFLISFYTFFTSDFIVAYNSYFTILSNAFVVIDAVAMFVRFIEARNKDRAARAEDDEALQESIALTADIENTLGLTNERLNDFRRSLQILICRRAGSIKRSSDTRYLQAAEDRQIDCSRLLKRIDKNYHDQEQELDTETEEVQDGKEDEEVNEEETTESGEDLQDTVVRNSFETETLNQEPYLSPLIVENYVDPKDETENLSEEIDP